MTESSFRQQPSKLRAALLRRGLPALSLAAVCAGAQAQNAGATADLPAVVVTGSRLPVTPSGLAQDVTIIDRRQIQESNPARLEDVLSRVAGVYVDQVGTAGGFSSLYMRGAEQSHLLIMLDGVKLNDPTTTRGSAFDLSAIDVNRIERIEILRGPASAIHGGEALAGVVHIITRRNVAAGVHGSGYLAAGGEGYRKAGGSLSFGSDKVQGQVSLGETRDEGPDNSASLRLRSFSGSLRFTPADKLEAELFAHRIERDSKAFPDDSGGPRLSVNRVQTARDSTDRIYGLKLAAGEASSGLLRAGVSISERDERSDNPFIAGGVRFPVPAFVSDTHFRRSTYYITAQRDWSPSISVVAGLEYQTEDGGLTSVGDFNFDRRPDTLSFQLKRNTKSVFAEGRFRLADPLTLQVGVRHDKVDGISGQTTPHLGLVYAMPNGATTLKASYSEGFKPPSFFALGFPIGGNPALRPESSRNAELSLAHRLDSKGSSLQVGVYQIEYKDLVDFDAKTFSNINRGKVVVRGIEPTLKFAVSDRLKTQFSITLLDIDERDGLAPLRNRPKKKATGSATYDIDGRSSVFAFVNHSGRFLDRSNPTGDIMLDGATTVDVGYARRFGPVQMRLAVDNLFDKKYEQFVGFPARGRRLRMELRSEF